MLFILIFPPPSKKATHWLLFVSGAVGIPKYGVNDGVSLMFPEFPKYYVINIILFSYPMTYPVIRSTAALVDEGFAMDTVW